MAVSQPAVILTFQNFNNCSGETLHRLAGRWSSPKRLVIVSKSMSTKAHKFHSTIASSTRRLGPEEKKEAGDGWEKDMEAHICLVLGASPPKVAPICIRIKTALEKKSTDGSEKTAVVETSTVFKQQCGNCGTDDERHFRVDPRQGSLVCFLCGMVLDARTAFEGDWTRSFEGDVSQRQHGPAPDRLMSEESHFKIKIGSGADARRSEALRRAQRCADMSTSSRPNAEHRTRAEYKNEMKRLAFERIQVAGSKADLHGTVVERAEEIFAEYRKKREHLHDFDEVLAACLIMAQKEAHHRAALSAASGSTAASIPQRGTKRSFSSVEGGGGVSGVPAPTGFSCTKCRVSFGTKRGLKFHRCPGASGAAESAGGEHCAEARIVRQRLEALDHAERRNKERRFGEHSSVGEGVVALPAAL